MADIVRAVRASTGRALLVAVVLMLAGCGQSAADRPTSADLHGSSPISGETPQPDAAFIADLTASGAVFATSKPVPLIGYGHELCSDLDAGQTVAEVTASSLSGEAGDKAWSVLVRAAIDNFCPQHAKQITS